jgi:hypothetical protein
MVHGFSILLCRIHYTTATSAQGQRTAWRLTALNLEREDSIVMYSPFLRYVCYICNAIYVVVVVVFVAVVAVGCSGVCTMIFHVVGVRIICKQASTKEVEKQPAENAGGIFGCHYVSVDETARGTHSTKYPGEPRRKVHIVKNKILGVYLFVSVVQRVIQLRSFARCSDDD